MGFIDCWCIDAVQRIQEIIRGFFLPSKVFLILTLLGVVASVWVIINFESRAGLIYVVMSLVSLLVFLNYKGILKSFRGRA